MSDSASGDSAVEHKGRKTRSSVTGAGGGAQMNEYGRGDDIASARQTRSGTGTPTSLDLSGHESVSEPPAMKKGRMGSAVSTTPQVRRLRSNKLNTEEESDKYCWICRKDGFVISCQICPRVYHFKCLGYADAPPEDWVCIECEKVMRSECEDTKPRTLLHFTLDQLVTALQYTLERMKVPNSEVFQVAVDPAQEPEYHTIIAHPVDMSLLERNVKKKVYGSTEAFLADTKWILHNSIIYNGIHNKYTMVAKTVLKMCKSQVMEIETCPDCFLASCVQENDWFATPCRNPHPLVWAKLKGYPFWPAKALREVDGQVDCRFFGAHDKAWVTSGQVFMLSHEPPVVVKNKKGSGFDEAMEEMEIYIKKYKEKHGNFAYAESRLSYKAAMNLDATSPSIETRKRSVESDGVEIPSKKPTIDVSETSGASSENSKPQANPPLSEENKGVFNLDESRLKEASVESAVPDRVQSNLAQTESVLKRLESKIKQSPYEVTEDLSLGGGTPMDTSQAPESPPQSEVNQELSTSVLIPLEPRGESKFAKELEKTIETVQKEVNESEAKSLESESSESDDDVESYSDDNMPRARTMTTFERRMSDKLTKQLYLGMKGTIREAVLQCLRGDAITPLTNNHPDNEATHTNAGGDNATSSPNNDEQDKLEEDSSVKSTNLTESDKLTQETIEKLKWKHKSEIESIKHNAELTAMEMRKSVESEKERALWRLRKQLEHKFKKLIDETKKKQWCAVCGKEAIFYCCWNTSYCDYPCQQKHWPSHLKTCAQIQKDGGGGGGGGAAHESRKSPTPRANKTNGVPGHEVSAGAPPPYSSTSDNPALQSVHSSTSLAGPQPVSQYQLMAASQLQYMPVTSTAAQGPASLGPAPLYQAQLPIQGVQMQASPRGHTPASAPLIYPVMQPPSASAPPQPQSFMLSQRQPYRLAPKYN